MSTKRVRVDSVRRARSRRGEGGRLAADILRAAAEIIEQTGDESTVTLTAVARRVGISVPAIYGHFSGADEICQQVVVRCWTEYARLVSNNDDQSLAPEQRIVRFAHAYVAFARAHWGWYRVLFCRDSASEVPEVGAPAVESFSRLVGGMALLSGVEADSPKAFEDALGLWIQLHGIASLPPAHPRFPWPGSETLVEAALLRSGIHPSA